MAQRDPLTFRRTQRTNYTKESADLVEKLAAGACEAFVRFAGDNLGRRDLRSLVLSKRFVAEVRKEVCIKSTHLLTSLVRMAQQWTVVVALACRQWRTRLIPSQLPWPRCFTTCLLSGAIRVKSLT